MTTARLELRGIRKSFPGTLANDDVSLSIAPGEIHALLGENGAGKSTLVKILYGVLKADAGSILWNGARQVKGSTRRHLHCTANELTNLDAWPC